MLWEKGIDILLALMHDARTGKVGDSNGDGKPSKDDPFPITIFGSGSDLKEVGFMADMSSMRGGGAGRGGGQEPSERSIG